MPVQTRRGSRRRRSQCRSSRRRSLIPTLPGLKESRRGTRNLGRPRGRVSTDDQKRGRAERARLCLRPSRRARRGWKPPSGLRAEVDRTRGPRAGASGKSGTHPRRSSARAITEKTQLDSRRSWRLPLTTDSSHIPSLGRHRGLQSKGKPRQLS